jgi:outer membrane protein OmpA-like peptidoglycan-associated protein
MDAAMDTASPPAGPEVMRTNLLDLRSELKTAFQKYSPRDLSSINSYLYALARIEVTYQYLLENFKGKDGLGLTRIFGMSAKEQAARNGFEACSLLAEIAFLQMSRNELEGAVRTTESKSDSINREMTAVYESIVKIERGRASELKAKLEEENAKNRALRDEADRKFNDLQSELIKVRKDVRGTIISMSDLLFAFDKADLTNDLKTALAKIAGILSVYKKCTVLVEGHTDNIGTADYNKDLSARRASNVKEYLVAQGVEAGRLTSVGYGFTKPVATNTTKEGRQKNRRVDLVVADKR